MRKLIFVAGVAALALSAPVSAKPDKGGGGHGNKGGGQAAHVERGGGGHQANRGGGGGGERRAFRMERRGGGERRAARMEHRGGERRQFAIERHGGGERRFAHAQRDRNERKAQRLEHRGNERRFAKMQQRNERQAQRLDRRAQRTVVRAENRGRGKDRIELRDRDRFADRRDAVRIRDFDQDRWNRTFADRGIPAGFVGGCPPGLAKKNPRCVPPGQAKNALIGSVLPTAYRSNLLPLRLRDIYRDDDDHYYRYGDGYVYRVDRDRDFVNALYPLIGAGYGIGQPFPYMNSPAYYVPSYYQPFYQDTPYYDYRYANGYVYQVDPYSGLVQDMVPLLDRGYGVGQMLPASYSYYNVPYQYRSLYYDTPDYAYRYAPGAIYQVDPQSQLITSVASLLAPGLSVGQALPMGYGMYNVPLAYRDTYYDTPDSWYRYSNGYIYQVDPTTQIVQAIVASLLT